MARRSKQRPASRPAICDVFELTTVVAGAELAVHVVTDLPLKTPIELEITRPSQKYIWTNLEDAFPVVPLGVGAGFEFRETIENLDQWALNKYRHWKGRWPSAIEGVPQDILHIRVSLNALKHQFGACNRDLTGTQIEVRRSGHWIEKTISVVAAIPDWLPDKLP